MGISTRQLSIDPNPPIPSGIPKTSIICHLFVQEPSRTSRFPFHNLPLGIIRWVSRLDLTLHLFPGDSSFLSLLPELLHELEESFLPKAKAKGLPIFFDWSTLLPDTIQSDALKLKQILSNIISNAIKFSRPMP